MYHVQLHAYLQRACVPSQISNLWGHFLSKNNFWEARAPSSAAYVAIRYNNSTRGQHGIFYCIIITEFTTGHLHTCIHVQEIIQNADDAKAEEVKFVLDHHDVPTISSDMNVSSLAKSQLSKFCGPALLAFNNALFSEKDWKSIQKLQQSEKAENPFKVGKFGIGFNSVYHITGE